MSKQTFVKNEWLCHIYSIWLEPVEDKTSAYCKKCRKTFRLLNMGETDIKSNVEGPKHVANSKPVNCVFKLKAISKPTSSSTFGEPTV